MTGVPGVRTSSLLTVTLAATLLLAGCGSEEPVTPDADAPASSPTTSRTSSPAPTASATPSASDTPDATASASARQRPRGIKTGALELHPRPRKTALADHLLGADAMPTLGGRAWTVDSTAPEDPAKSRAVGACQKTGLGTIGAVEAVRRTFSAPGGVSAVEVVARFADRKSAWRAHQVLLSWRDDCADRLDEPRAEVGPIEPVRVATGTAGSYRASYGPGAGDQRHAAGLAILRTADHLTLVEVTAGLDRYPTAWDPARVAARRIARTFQP